MDSQIHENNKQDLLRDLIRDAVDINVTLSEPESRTSPKFSAAGGRHRMAFDPRIRASAAFSRNGYETEPCIGSYSASPMSK